MIKAWHFTGDTLRNGDPIPAIGEPLIHDGPVKMCESGFHASRSMLDALKYAPGPICHRVRCEDIVEDGKDKLVCRRRTILWSVDAEEVLRRFARRCALDVAHLWPCPTVVMKYLKTGREKFLPLAWPEERSWVWASAWAAESAAAAAKVSAWARQPSESAWAAAKAKAGAAAAAAAKAKVSAWARQPSESAWAAAAAAAWARQPSESAWAAAKAKAEAKASASSAAESRQNRRLTAMIVSRHLNNLKAQKRGNSGGDAK